MSSGYDPDAEMLRLRAELAALVSERERLQQERDEAYAENKVMRGLLAHQVPCHYAPALRHRLRAAVAEEEHVASVKMEVRAWERRAFKAEAQLAEAQQAALRNLLDRIKKAEEIDARHGFQLPGDSALNIALWAMKEEEAAVERTQE